MDEQSHISASAVELNHQDVRLLGRSAGITGIVQTALHRPTNSLLAVKRYNMDRKKEERSEEENSEAADFHELAKTVKVSFCFS